MAIQAWEPKAGDLVEVRSKEEILSTLDKDGRLDGLPFMPGMFQYCGRRFAVRARAHKTCDVIGGKGRWLPDGVHLDTRCDGLAYGGCQAGCLIFWKRAWLKPVASTGALQRSSNPVSLKEPRPVGPPVSACTENDVWRATRADDRNARGQVVYSCQATRVSEFTRPMASWDIRQYLEDYRSGNVSLARLARGFLYQTYHHGTMAWRCRFGRPARWVYDLFQAATGGPPFPIKPGTLPAGTLAPISNLNLQPGELVRIRSHQEILSTIHKGGMNRGLLFDKEMVPFCGKVFRVKARVTTFVNERTGTLETPKTPALILEGVWCQSRYSNNKMFCPRSLYTWWREIWLERIPEGEYSKSLFMFDTYERSQLTVEPRSTRSEGD